MPDWAGVTEPVTGAFRRVVTKRLINQLDTES